MSATPRTDEAEFEVSYNVAGNIERAQVVASYTCRQLEAECRALREALREIRDATNADFGRSKADPDLDTEMRYWMQHRAAKALGKEGK